MGEVKITLGEPTIVVQGPPEERRWGRYQFPSAERLSNGVIDVKYHVFEDSATEYGKECPHSLSVDNGRTFFKSEKPLEGGLLLPNGDRIRIKVRPSLNPSDLDLPEPATKKIVYSEFVMYRAEEIPEEYSGYTIERLAAGTYEWKTEIKHVKVPGALRYRVSGVFPHQMIVRMRIAPDGRIWGINYDTLLNEKGESEWNPVFIVSDDFGATFKFLSKIPFQPQPDKDPNWELRQDFHEPDVAFMPDGSILCVMRTENGLPRAGDAPIYMCRSTDGGLNWSKPEVFDTFGVWPGFIGLRNGITLLCYGRLGVFIRATADVSGLTWDDRVEVVKPGADFTGDTCGYCDWVALSDDTALFVYSDFQYPNADGIPVKTILARTVTATRA